MDRAVARYSGDLPDRRHRDAATLLALMSRATGEEPRMWGSIVGFGRYHYKYASGREGEAPGAGFAARKAATTIYLADGVHAHGELLARLGPHRTGVGCVSLKGISDVDLEVLETIVRRSHTALTEGQLDAQVERRVGGHDAAPAGGA